MPWRRLLRMAIWARRPPSERRVKLVFGVIVLVLALFAVERLLGWPDWLTLDSRPGGPVSR